MPAPLPAAPPPGIALFDLDGTLIAWDCQLLFRHFVLRRERWRGIFLPVFLMFLPLAPVLGAVESQMLGGPHPVLATGYEGYALRETVPVADLPARIHFQPGAVSLVADPEDTRGDYLTVYLVNDTDEPLPEAIGELLEPTSQVRVQGGWISDKPLVGRCGTVAPPKDLPGRTSLAFGGWFSRDGSFKTERRFVFGEFVSEPIPGVFSSGNIDGALGWWPDERASQRRLNPELWNNVASNRLFAGTSEEVVALLELARHRGQFIDIRNELWRWIMERQADGPTPEQERLIAGLTEVLGKPWWRFNDRKASTERGLAALRAEGPASFGTPENCRAAVWRYLVNEGSYYGYGARVRKPEAETLLALARLAEATIREGTAEDEIMPAIQFISSGPVIAAGLSETEFRSFLDSGNPALALAGIAGLGGPEHGDAAGIWLAEHLDEMAGRLAASYYQATWRRSINDVRDWEYAVITRLLDEEPLEAMKFSEGRIRSVARQRHPAAWTDSLRTFLRRENEPEQRRRWDQRASASRKRPDDYQIANDARSLADGVRLLLEWGNADDDGLFRQLLNHPAAVVTTLRPGVLEKNHPVRAAAMDALKFHGQPLPDSLVLKEPIVCGSEDRSKRDGGALRRHGPLGVAFLGGAGLVGLPVWWRRKRRRPDDSGGGQA